MPAPKRAGPFGGQGAARASLRGPQICSLIRGQKRRGLIAQVAECACAAHCAAQPSNTIRRRRANCCDLSDSKPSLIRGCCSQRRAGIRRALIRGRRLVCSAGWPTRPAPEQYLADGAGARQGQMDSHYPQVCLKSSPAALKRSRSMVGPSEIQSRGNLCKIDICGAGPAEWRSGRKQAQRLAGPNLSRRRAWLVNNNNARSGKITSSGYILN